MYDRITIVRDGRTYEAGRYLRDEGDGTRQTIFYGDSMRTDRQSYARFAADDPAMNVAAAAMLESMIDEADERRARARVHESIVTARGGRARIPLTRSTIVESSRRNREVPVRQ